jgi:hypothetical protein
MLDRMDGELERFNVSRPLTDDEPRSVVDDYR